MIVECLPGGQHGFQVRDVVAGQGREGGGSGEPGLHQGRADGGVTEHDRHLEVPDDRKEPVVLVAFDDHNVAPGGEQAFHGGQPDRTEPADDDVVTRGGGPPASDGPFQPAADDHIGDERVDDRDGQRADEDQRDAERL